jgi:hypothetical protein
MGVAHCALGKPVSNSSDLLDRIFIFNLLAQRPEKPPRKFGNG